MLERHVDDDDDGGGYGGDATEPSRGDRWESQLIPATHFADSTDTDNYCTEGEMRKRKLKISSYGSRITVNGEDGNMWQLSSYIRLLFFVDYGRIVVPLIVYFLLGVALASFQVSIPAQDTDQLRVCLAWACLVGYTNIDNRRVCGNVKAKA
ncbi:unnamed protein product [Angiostrongylus costaricensis]|uniref:Neur_chan_memb domain-containing protein n=2 Tax=Angiostrongylus TaxID=6312 RepID=A0A0R3PNF5_ANGCS|nr:unnamed protein product [Angiostrongylus costaricensis]